MMMMMIWEAATSVFVKRDNNDVLLIVSVLLPFLLRVCVLYVY